jgi:hypothetical protein
MGLPLEREAIITVIGAGAMGAGIAQVAAMAGHTVFLHDSRETAAASAISLIQIALQKLVEKDKLDAVDFARASARLTFARASARLTPAKRAVAYPREGVCSSFVQRMLQVAGVTPGEAAAVDAKGSASTPLLETQDPHAAVLYLTDGRSATERAHDSGTPNLALVDLALNYATTDRVALAFADSCASAARQEVVGLLQRAGWTVAVLDDICAMAVMRTVTMLANEAAQTVLQGVCSHQEVDVATEKGVNYPLGPLAWAQAIGFPQVCEVLDNLKRSYGEDRYRASTWLRRRAMRCLAVAGVGPITA